MAKSNAQQAEEQGATFGASRLEKTQGNVSGAVADNADIEPQHTGEAVWSDTVTISADKLQIPFLSLMQGLSKPVQEEKAKMGDWYMEGFGAFKEVVIVPLKFGISRNYSVKDAAGKPETACYSKTGVEHGIALMPDIGPGIPCDQCPLKEWQPTDRVVNGRKQNDPPPCKEAYDFLVWDETHGTLAKISFRSTGLKAGRVLATLGKTKGLGKFAISLTSKRDTANGFTFAVPEVSILPSSEAGDVLDMAQTIMALEAGS